MQASRSRGVAITCALLVLADMAPPDGPAFRLASRELVSSHQETTVQRLPHPLDADDLSTASWTDPVDANLEEPEEEEPDDGIPVPGNEPPQAWDEEYLER